jgi:hypothetical protein
MTDSQRAELLELATADFVGAVKIVLGDRNHEILLNTIMGFYLGEVRRAQMLEAVWPLLRHEPELYAHFSRIYSSSSLS